MPPIPPMPLAVMPTSLGGVVGSLLGMLILILVRRAQKARRAREESTTVGWVLGWRLRDGSLHSSTATANADELEVECLAVEKSLEPDVVETWVSRRTPAGPVRRYYVAGERE